VSLRPVTAGDGDEFVALARDSVSMHRGLIFAPATAAEFGEYLAQFDGATAIGFVVRLKATGELAGFVNLRNIVRDSGPSGALGFGGFMATAGHGYVAEAVRLAVRYAFGELGLDRLEADVQPANAASRKVVELAGFRPAGTAPKAIRIAGEWRDHERWMVTTMNAPWKAFKNLESRTCQAKS
jgi:[ribosomal protein S5]-alanine N-acetyltransferase